MFRALIPVLFSAALLTAPALEAQSSGQGHSQHGGKHAHPRPDTSFEALQERGKVAMGVDQYASTHRFDSLPEGGRIEYTVNTDDPEGIAQLRKHLKEIAQAFAKGDFSTPAFVHARTVPGTETMAALKSRITYSFRELPRGGEVRITTADPEALRAIHAFMSFQREDHRAGGHVH